MSNNVFSVSMLCWNPLSNNSDGRGPTSTLVHLIVVFYLNQVPRQGEFVLQNTFFEEIVDRKYKMHENVDVGVMALLPYSL